MFDIGWPELLVVAIVLIIVVGPKDLPPMLRAFGRTTKKLRAMAGEFRGQFDDALREAELDDVKKTFDDARKLNPMQTIRDAVNPLKDTAKDLKADLEKSVKTPSAAKETPPNLDVPEPGMKLADGPPDFKSPEPVATDPAAKQASKPPSSAAKSVASAKKAATKPPVAKSGQASVAAKEPAAKPKAAAQKPTAKATAAVSTAKVPAKPAPAKSAPRAKKPKGEGKA